MKQKVVFIGAGSMAEAIIAGLVQAQFFPNEYIFVTNKNDRSRLEILQKKYAIQSFKDKEVVRDADIVVLATKPVDVKEAIQSVQPYINSNQLIISVIAGLETSHIEDLFATNIPVIRAMPNTSASIGHSATAITAGQYATEKNIAFAEALFQTIGTTTVVQEEHMHAITSISGSGPAYFYYLVEAMVEAASELGLSRDVAKELIIQTVIGAGEMLRNTGETASDLREKITSPAGTTEAGIEALNSYNFSEAVKSCVKKAHDRSIELGKQ